MNLRTLAAQTLAPLLLHRGSLSATLPTSLYTCVPRDRALLQQLCYGTMRFEPRLALIAEHLLQKPFRDKDADLQALVLLGLYQLDQTRIADHAAISETVDVTEDLNKNWARGLVNAVLRRFQRERDSIMETLGDNPRLQYNHPDWMIGKLQQNWPDHWPQIMLANDQPAPMTLRLNTRLSTREAYIEQLYIAGIEATPGAFAKTAIYLNQPCDVSELPGFADGLVSVQDEAAQLSAPLLDLKPGQRVLDACAAPGGKLCHLLEHEPGLDSVEAVELDSRRAERIQQNLQRLKLNCTVTLGDAASEKWWDGQSYDRILIDAPCSATGVIRRHPDIKYLRRNEDLKRLADLQLSILRNCWHMLSPGGKLLYATCSIFPQENERLLARFIKEQPEVRHLPIEADWGHARPLGRQLFPQQDGHDGFYYAVLEKPVN
uniref:16S rRNA (cytosine(967)-C(5))-methyltransferase RsmB n=1 Tax=Marinobacterium profundum TaxID=1714300 RepID=UPI000833753D|nr:16S rRNA (cytosine(967)-C(5))-methyltransferase RsmB [Marinobacterium profundum]